MRKAFPIQRRLDAPSIKNIPLNFECRDEIVPILTALQHIYGQPSLRSQILDLIEADVNEHTRNDAGRTGMSYWQITVLASVRLGCNLDYDKLQDLAENHNNLRAMMGLGPWDQVTSFNWQRIRDNICLIKPETIDAISHLIVLSGHALAPEAVKAMRADSTVVETAIHYPTESTLIRDGVRKIFDLCVPLAQSHGLTGWRQSDHLYKRVKRSSREIERIAARKGKDYKERLKAAYIKLLDHSEKIVDRARNLLLELEMPPAKRDDIFGPNTLQAYIARTARVQDTARRRVIKAESVPHEEKLFSIFEPHTQLYKRGKAGQPVQFGRLVMIYEDGAGFITHRHTLPRFDTDEKVVVEQTRIVQNRFGGKIQRVSFDRGFHTPENQTELSEIVRNVCLPKPGVHQSAEQLADASEEYLAGVQNHPGVEATIGSLQSGNGWVRCRDKTERGFERYVALGILGRNLHTLGRLLIAKASPASEACQSHRKAA